MYLAASERTAHGLDGPCDDILRPWSNTPQSTVKQMAQNEAAQAEGAKPAVVTETTDGADVAYFVTTRPCVMDKNPKSTSVDMFARLIHDTTYADVAIRMFAANPDAARTYLREMLQKVGTLDYASIK